MPWSRRRDKGKNRAEELTPFLAGFAVNVEHELQQSTPPNPLFHPFFYDVDDRIIGRDARDRAFGVPGPSTASAPRIPIDLHLLVNTPPASSSFLPEENGTELAPAKGHTVLRSVLAPVAAEIRSSIKKMNLVNFLKKGKNDKAAKKTISTPLAIIAEEGK
jgi:hypothetical protein